MQFDQILEFTADSDAPAGQSRIDQVRQRLADTDVDPASVEREAREAFDATYNGGDYDIGDAPALEALADITDAARELAQQRATQFGGTKERVNDLVKRVNKRKSDNGSKSSQEGSDDEQDQEHDRRVEGKARGREEEGAGGGQAGEHGRSGSRQLTDDEPDDDEGDKQPRDRNGKWAPKSQEEDEDSADDDRDPDRGTRQHSSRRRMSLSAEDLNKQRSQSMPSGRAQKRYTVTASADTPDAQMGKNLSMHELAQAARQRMSSMPVGQPTEGELRRSIAQINREFDERFIVDGGSPAKDAEVIDWVADESRLPGGSLVAAAQQQADNLTAAGQAWATPPGDVWCSPSETDYSLCPPLATRTGILDLPSFQVRRGGIRYPVWKQYPEQHRPDEHGPGNREVANDQAQGWWPTHNPPENYPYDAPYVSAGPRHDWHGYTHANRNDVGASPDLEDPDYFLKNPKKHIQGPCVEWAEERMHTSYLWIEEDILRNHTYPELADRFMSDALLSHAHYMNETYIKWIVAHSDRLDPFWAGAPGWNGPGNPPQNGVVPPGPQSYPFPVASNNYYPGSALDFGSYGHFGMGSASEAVLERIGWLATWFRNTYRTDFKTTIEGFAPWWFREFLKLDIERKINRPHSLPVGNGEVDAYLRQWGVKLSWVYDWQDMPSTEYAPPYADVRAQHIMPRGGWPNAVDIVLYPAGAWALAEQNVIRLEGTYDSNRLRNNKTTSLFLEDAWMLLNRCNRSFVVQLRGLCANGATGEPWQACSPDVVGPPQGQREQAQGGQNAGKGNGGAGNGGGAQQDSGNTGGSGSGNGGTGKKQNGGGNTGGNAS